MSTKTIVESTSEFDAEELVALARIDLRQTRQDHALQKLKIAVRQPDCPPEGIALIGQIYADLGLFKRAQEWLGRYLEQNPKSPTELFQLGLTHMELGNRDQAKALWSSVLELMPNHPPALYFTAVAATLDNRNEDARRGLLQLFRHTLPDNQYVQQGRELLNRLDADLEAVKPVPGSYAVPPAGDNTPGALSH